MRLLCLIILLATFCILSCLISRRFDWWTVGEASLPIQPRGVDSSKAELLSLFMSDVSIDRDTPREYCASTELDIRGKVLLEHVDYQWSPTKRQLTTRAGMLEMDKMARLPRIAIAIRFERRSGNERGFDEDAAFYYDLLAHRGRECEWHRPIKLPARTGKYRMAIDLVEYDDFSTMLKPKKQHQLFEAPVQIVEYAGTDAEQRTQ